jgi:O-antigen/teichoic acid export membrane protein
VDNSKPLSAIAGVGIASIAGIIATFLFQILTARSLGPADYGLFAAFLAIVNIGAIGSGALQNSVTVQTAHELQKTTVPGKNKFFDPTLIEALAIGFAGLILLLAVSPTLSQSLNASIPVIVIAGLSFPFSFLLARNLGIIQGHGLAQQTVWWSTGAAGIRLILGVIAILLVLGLAGFIGTVIASLVIISIWLALYLRNVPRRPQHAPFNRATIAVLLSTILFAWLTNVDVVFVRALVQPEESGNYAVLASLVKTGFIIPGTLSLYFLPRLVGKTKSSSTLKIPMLITVTGILILTLVLWLLGPQLISLLFGSQYQVSSLLVVIMCFSAAPWVISQTLLIRTNALATLIAPMLLAASTAIQWPVMTLSLPNIENMLILNGLIGLGLALSLWTLISYKSKTTD